MIKKIGKRLLPVLLSVLLLLSVIPMQSFAASTEPEVNDYESFMLDLYFLELIANEYVAYVNPAADPLDLVIKYIRTGVERYNSGSWGIMAGYEDTDFAAFVAAVEEENNSAATSEDEKIYISALKNINDFKLPNGDLVDFGHMFGTMDITYHNDGSENHADVGGWAGDLVDLLEISDIKGVSGKLEEMTEDIRKNYLGKDFSPDAGFDLQDIYGDRDAYYIMNTLSSSEYQVGMLYTAISEYFTESLDDADRAKFLLENRLGTTGTRAQIREAVYNAYTSNR